MIYDLYIKRKGHLSISDGRPYGYKPQQATVII